MGARDFLGIDLEVVEEAVEVVATTGGVGSDVGRPSGGSARDCDVLLDWGFLVPVDVDPLDGSVVGDDDVLPGVRGQVAGGRGSGGSNKSSGVVIEAEVELVGSCLEEGVVLGVEGIVGGFFKDEHVPFVVVGLHPEGDGESLEVEEGGTGDGEIGGVGGVEAEGIAILAFGDPGVGDGVREVDESAVEAFIISTAVVPSVSLNCQ